MNRSLPHLKAASTDSSSCNNAGDERSVDVNSVASFMWASFRKPNNLVAAPVGGGTYDWAAERAVAPSADPITKWLMKLWSAKMSAFPLRKSCLILLFQDPLNQRRSCSIYRTNNQIKPDGTKINISRPSDFVLTSISLSKFPALSTDHTRTASHGTDMNSFLFPVNPYSIRRDANCKR